MVVAMFLQVGSVDDEALGRLLTFETGMAGNLRVPQTAGSGK